MLSLIVAMDQNRLIGDKNRLPWHLSEDLKRFKALTLGKPIIMGRKTFESIGKPLPGRRNIVVSRNVAYQAPGCETVGCLAEAVKQTAGASEAIIIGGSQLYREALPLVDRMYITLIEHAFTGDTWFPDYDESEWNLIAIEDFHHRGESASFTVKFKTFERGRNKNQINDG